MAVFYLVQKLLAFNSFENLENYFDDKIELISIICSYLVDELNKQQLSDSKSNFLLDHVESIQNRISDETIRNYNSLMQ